MENYRNQLVSKRTVVRLHSMHICLFIRFVFNIINIVQHFASRSLFAVRKKFIIALLDGFIAVERYSNPLFGIE